MSKMSKEVLHGLIDMIADEDIDTIIKILIKFIPEDEPTPDEIQAIADANEDIKNNGVVSHEDIDWD